VNVAVGYGRRRRLTAGSRLAAVRSAYGLLAVSFGVRPKRSAAACGRALWSRHARHPEREQRAKDLLSLTRDSRSFASLRMTARGVSRRQPNAPPRAAAASLKAASRAHRRQQPASRQPPPPTIADSDVAPFPSALWLQQTPNVRVLLSKSPQRNAGNPKSGDLVDESPEQFSIRHPQFPHAWLNRVQRQG